MAVVPTWWDGQFGKGLQYAAFVLSLLALAEVYGPLRSFYWRLLYNNKLLVLELVLVVAIVYGLGFTTTYGLPSLFWHKEPLREFSAGGSCALFVALIAYILYFVNAREIDEDPAWAAALRAILVRVDRLRLGRLRPRLDSGRQLHRMWAFLAATGLPLLVLLALPGLLPALRPEADPYEPAPGVIWRRGAVAPFWLLGLATGAAGSFVLVRGRFFMKIVILASALAVPVAWAIRLLATGSPVRSAHEAVGRFLVRREAIRGRRAGRRYDPSSSSLDLIYLYLFIYGLSFTLQVALGRGKLGGTFSPAFLITVVALGLVAAAYAYFAARSIRHQIGFFAVLLAGLVLNGLEPYKLTFPGLERYYPPDGLGRLARAVNRGLGRPTAPEGKPVDLRAGIPPCPDSLLEDGAVLDAWRASFGAGAPPKLVVVAASGGGIRAALWTAVVLRGCEEALRDELGLDFARHVRVITGASGGMVGAAHYVTRVAAGAPRDEAFVDALAQDFLSAPIRRMILRDLPTIFCPFRIRTDRGRILEEQWIRATHLGPGPVDPALPRDGMAMTFAELRPLEARGAAPSLIFAPMLVEDGRRLLISNLDLSAMMENRVPLLAGAPEAHGLASLAALQFFQLFPDATGFRVSTAARMNATFPFVSPAVSLPTIPPRRVVDAGFFDNYGVELAVSWIDENRDWVLANTSGLLLIQVRAFTNEEALTRPAADASPAPWPDDVLGRGAQFLTSPFSGAAESRYASMVLRNDAMIERLGSDLNVGRDRDFFQTVVFSGGHESPSADGPGHGPKAARRRHDQETLSWYVTSHETAVIKGLAPYSRDGPVDEINSGRMKTVLSWWRARRSPAGER